MKAHKDFIIAIMLLSLLCGRSISRSGETSSEVVSKRSEIDLVRSGVVSGYSVGLTDEMGTTNTSPTRRLCFAILNQASPNARAVLPAQEYSFRVTLTDADGKVVAKTPLGKMVGSRFEDFNNSYLKKRKVGREMVLVSTEDRPNLYVIFRPSDVFKLTKPGAYCLSIEFQMIVFPQIGPKPSDRTNQVVRFPTIKYPMVYTMTNRAASGGIVNPTKK